MRVDYKKLLKRCIKRWFEAEGSAWDGDGSDDGDLTEEEKETVRLIWEEEHSAYLNSGEKGISYPELELGEDGKPYKVRDREESEYKKE